VGESEEHWRVEVRRVVGATTGPLVGIDAGGSSTRALRVEPDGSVYRVHADPMNALLTSHLANRCAAIAGETPLAAVGVGMPGLRSERAARALERTLTHRLGCPAAVVGDAEIARLGAFLGRPGVVVVAGTGSVAVGHDGHRSARAGGHGFLLGDEGGAYWIGREGVRAALAFRDRLGGSATLLRAIEDASGAGLDRLVAQVHERPTDRRLLGRLAPTVTALAPRDPVADAIVRRAAAQLARLAEAVRGQLGDLPVAAVGGVFGAPALWSYFTDLVDAARPAAPPEVGAVLLARTAAGRAKTDVGRHPDASIRP